MRELLTFGFSAVEDGRASGEDEERGKRNNEPLLVGMLVSESLNAIIDLSQWPMLAEMGAQ